MRYSDKVIEFVNDINDGAGWATDDYVRNFAPANFTERDSYNAMVLLAQKGMLYDEENITPDEAESSDRPSDEAKMSPEQVAEFYGGDVYMENSEAAK